MKTAVWPSCELLGAIVGRGAGKEGARAKGTTEIQGKQIQTVNARDLHSFLESKWQFSNWIKSRIDAYDFTEGVDFISIKDLLYSPPRIEYHLTLDMAPTRAKKETHGFLISGSYLFPVV